MSKNHLKNNTNIFKFRIKINNIKYKHLECKIETKQWENKGLFNKELRQLPIWRNTVRSSLNTNTK